MSTIQNIYGSIGGGYCLIIFFIIYNCIIYSYVIYYYIVEICTDFLYVQFCFLFHLANP